MREMGAGGGRAAMREMGAGGGRAARVPRGGAGFHGGGGRSRRRRRIRGDRVNPFLGDVSNVGSSDAYSNDEKSSSSDGVDVVRRKRILDDAFFDFFSKEAIKSLKRDFSKFYKDSDLWSESKRQKLPVIGKDSYYVFSAKYFFEVLHRLSLEQRAVIEKFGFGCLLTLSKTDIPSSFTRWLAWSVDSDSSQIIVDDKILNLSKFSIEYVLGLPSSGSPLSDSSEGGIQFILALFQLSEVPHITFFGNKLISNEILSDQQVFVCFMEIALSCFLLPSYCDRIHTKFIEQLGDPERARRFDIADAVYKHLIHGVMKCINFTKCNGRKSKVFEFCTYVLAVYYLDSLNFGVHIAGTGLPRSLSWQGDMIRVYSELDRKSSKRFGKRRMRTNLPSCYIDLPHISIQNSINCEVMSIRHKESMHDQFGLSLAGKTIDGIYDIVKSSVGGPIDNRFNPEMLVHNVLKFLVDARPWYNSTNKSCPSSVAHLSHGKFAVTPAGPGINLVDTAPVVKPVAKSKSRLCVQVPSNSESVLCQADLISPIGRIKLSAHPDEKDLRKPVMKSSIDIYPNNSKLCPQSPILVDDTSSKSPLVVKSPEVTITGACNFRDRQQHLVGKVDAEYNKAVHPASGIMSRSVTNEVINLEDLAGVVDLEDDKAIAGASNTVNRSSNVNGYIVLQPKNTLVFPLALNSRFPVSDEDIMHYCAIVELAYKETIQKYYALKYHGVHCSYISLGQTLMPEGHVDNFLIPCFCRKLFEDKHPTKSGRHYFFPYIGESILKLSTPTHESLVRTSFLGAASASKGKRLDFSDRLCFPVCHLDHWFNFVVDFKYKLFIFLDSLYGRESDYQQGVQGPLIHNFALLWEKIFETDEPDFKKFKVMFPAMPMQGNGHDCGIFTMKALEVFVPEKNLRRDFSKDDVQNIRIQYANQLFFHGGNHADQSLVTNFFSKDDFMAQLH